MVGSTDKVYLYWAKVTNVYDGDTLTADISVGFGITLAKQKLRLYGIDTPEIRGGTEETKAAARTSRDRLRGLVLDRWIVLETIKDEKGKYGRYLAIIWLPENDVEPYGLFTDVNSLLVAEGLAEEKYY